MALTIEQKENIKKKAAGYLERSVYELSVLLGIDPDLALSANAIIDFEIDVSTSEIRKSTESLLAQVKSLRAL